MRAMLWRLTWAAHCESTDWVRPIVRSDGGRVLTAIRDDSRLVNTPVVVLTSSDERTDLAACYALGCNAFVRKPVEFTEYTRDLRTTLDFWLNVNLSPPTD